MPNHVHVLLTPHDDRSLKSIVQPLKSFSAVEIRKQLGDSGSVWQPDYFDRLIRDEGHFERVLRYIEWNPVKAGLCSDPKHWPHSSANSVLSEQLIQSCEKAHHSP